MTTALPTSRIAVAVLAAAVATLVFLGEPAPSAAADNCAKQIVSDWYEDGRVDRLFPLHCYLDAIASLPIDVVDYGNAREDILRALAYAKRGKPDPGDPGATGGKGGSGSTGGKSGTSPTGGKGGTSSTGGKGGTTEPETEPTVVGTGEQPATEQVAGGTIDTSGPSALPLPLLLLAALAVLLLAAGGIGYLRRRRTARAHDGDDRS